MKHDIGLILPTDIVLSDDKDLCQNAEEFLDGMLSRGTPGVLGCGYEPRNFYSHPTVGKPFDLDLIPQDQWDDLIEEGWENETFLIHYLDTIKSGVKDQKQTNFCWIFCVIRALEILMDKQRGSHVSLSPASAGTFITNGKNIGGWPGEGLEHVLENGVAPSSLWPDTAISFQYDTPEVRTERQKYKPLEWSDLPAKSLPAIMTLVLNRMPGCGGYMHMSHAVTPHTPVKRGGQYGLICDNSWGPNSGENGRMVLLGSKSIHDECVAPRTVMPG